MGWEVYRRGYRVSELFHSNFSQTGQDLLEEINKSWVVLRNLMKDGEVNLIQSLFENENEFLQDVKETYELVCSNLDELLDRNADHVRLYNKEEFKGIKVTFQGEGCYFAAKYISWRYCLGKEYTEQSNEILLTLKDFCRIWGRSLGEVFFEELLFCLLDDEREKQNVSGQALREIDELSNDFKESRENTLENIKRMPTSQRSRLSQVSPYVLISGGGVLGAVCYLASIAGICFAVSGLVILPASLYCILAALALASLVMMAWGVFSYMHRTKVSKVNGVSDSTVKMFSPSETKKKINCIAGSSRMSCKTLA